MKYLTSVSEQELSACLAQASHSVTIQQKKWRLQVIAFFCAIALLGSMVLVQTGVFFPTVWAAHSRIVMIAVLVAFVVIIFTSAFVNSHLHSVSSEIKHEQNDTHLVNYNIDLNEEGIRVSAASEKSQENTQYFWAAIKKVYLFNNGIMILGYAKKAKASILLPFNGAALQPTMQRVVDEMRMHLPPSIFVSGHF
ncbi:MAG: hypothetical protein K0R48_1276 [Gammaproteobacteria bacterium]|jgi:hypothetical protein|nr:hypothetical protein [Gammaproteobacteria bacterium]